ncbi:S8 family peptidase [Exiguobacterium artemiae]|uniref:S8 family peptidase n=1 Tax=Exiguobacterium artemiae TaxID=340145 RepID=UPI0029656690|nr:S8 family serine peptidase [Exiguobacterium sibiricum]MDW2886326.1 S8 family serine peptidase [Exiguobacterium sibiricum]
MKWKQWVSGLALVTVSLVWSETSNAEESSKQQERVIVQVKGNNVTHTSKEVLLKKTSASSAIYTLDIPSGKTMKNYINELKAQPEVVRVETDYRLKHLYTPNDSDFDLQSQHENIETQKAWNKTKGSANVIVAVIDDGIDLYHEDLKNNIVSPYDIVEGSDETIPLGEHGTHVAGIIAGEIDNYTGGAGIAPKTKIMPLNVFEGDGAYSSDVIEAIYHAVDHDADIINMSLGNYYYSWLYQEAIDYAHDSGLVIVAAAGNEETDEPSYPASYDHVVSVASTTPWDSPSYFSNYGPTIDVSAPGSYIYSTLPYDKYGEMSGTSMASPVVAGVAALIKANEPNLTGDQIVKRLIETSDDLGDKGKDDDYGYGRVNAAKAVNTSVYGPLLVDAFTDQSMQVTGQLPYDVSGGIISVYTSSNKVIGQVKQSQKGKFTISVPKQLGGLTLSVSIEDDLKNKSSVTTFKVIDKTSPTVPKVNVFSDSMTTLTGTAENKSTIIAMNGSKKVGQAISSSGKFSVKLPKQKAGTILTIYAMDAAKNKSREVRLKVIDKTAPAVPTASAVTTKTTSISGKTEAKAAVYLYKGTTKVASSTADAKGMYKLTFKAQASGTKLSLYAIDSAKNKSKTKLFTVSVFKKSNSTYLKEHYAAAKKGTMYKAEAKLYDRMKIKGKDAIYGIDSTSCCVFGKVKASLVYGTIGFDERYPNHIGDIMTMPSFDQRKIKWTEFTSALGKPKVHLKTEKNEWNKMLYVVNNQTIIRYERAGTLQYKPTTKTTFWADYDYNGYVRAFGLSNY